MSGSSFHGYYIAFFQRNFVAVAEITLAGIFELNFHHVRFLCIAGNVGKPVVSVQLLVLPAAAFAAETAASVM